MGDVSRLIGQSAVPPNAKGFDAIILDLYRGPHARTDKRDDPFYGSRAIKRTHTALNPGGIFAVWGEGHDEGFVRRLSQAGFSVTCERPGKGGYRHVVFLAEKKI